MSKRKVRCVDCGAKNADDLADRCRLCGGLLPDAVRRRDERLNVSTSGPAFAAIVEQEVEAWREFERRGAEGPRTRRPDEKENPNKGRWGWRRSR